MLQIKIQKSSLTYKTNWVVIETSWMKSAQKSLKISNLWIRVMTRVRVNER